VNLLISMGDSWTAGVGCYNDTALDQLSRKEIHIDELMPLSLDSFAEGCWPKQLTDKLGWDLINLSNSGCSNSGQAKILFDSIPDDLCKKYDNVFVIWLLSDPYRPSFYVNNKVESYSTNTEMYKMGVKISKRTDKDAELETNFYVKCVEKFCKSNTYKFLFGSGWVPYSVDGLTNHKSNMHKSLKYDSFKTFIPKNMYSYCGHPTIHGYTFIMDEIYNLITNNYLKDIQ
jgi:hypothetical protein